LNQQNSFKTSIFRRRNFRPDVAQHGVAVAALENEVLFGICNIIAITKPAFSKLCLKNFCSQTSD
jgi:hypothetical protein